MTTFLQTHANSSPSSHRSVPWIVLSNNTLTQSFKIDSCDVRFCTLFCAFITLCVSSFGLANQRAHSQSSPGPAHLTPYSVASYILTRRTRTASHTYRVEPITWEEIDQIRKKRRNKFIVRNLSEFSKKFVRGIWRHLLGLHLKLHHTCRSCIYLFIYTFYCSIYLTYKSTSLENRGKRGEVSAELTYVETSSNIWQDVMEGEKVTKKLIFFPDKLQK